MLVAKGNAGGDFETCPEGTFVGRLFQIVDLGTVDKEYSGVKSKKREVRLGFEILDDQAVRKDGKPFEIGENYTMSLDKKANLCKALEQIRGKKFTPEELEGFNLVKALGVYCQITIIHVVSAKNGNTYANISAFSPLHKTMAKPAAVNADLVFDLDAQDYLDHLPKLAKFVRERIEVSDEMKIHFNDPKAKAAAQATPGAVKEEFQDDVPF